MLLSWRDGQKTSVVCGGTIKEMNLHFSWQGITNLKLLKKREMAEKASYFIYFLISFFKDLFIYL